MKERDGWDQVVTSQWWAGIQSCVPIVQHLLEQAFPWYMTVVSSNTSMAMGTPLQVPPDKFSGYIDPC